METILIYIFCSSVILMLILGAVKLIVVDVYYTSRPWYPRYKKIMQIVMLGLTVLCAASMAMFAAIYFYNELRNAK